jgi:tetratricopeptide (TPR) repeat protein
MSELISALVNIKGPFTLFAFLALVALVAFRTKLVPELFFGLLKEKLTREKFSQLLHRFMFYGFTVFIVLCAVSVVGQYLSYKIQAGPVSREAGSAEIQNSQYPDDKKKQALAAYQEGISDAERHEIADAIKKLEDSLAQVPTLSAHFTLAYLYQQDGKQAEATEQADAAYALAQERKDSLAMAKAEQLRKEIKADGKPKQDCPPLLGKTAELPKGATFCTDAPLIGPGLYVYNQSFEDNKRQYFKINVKQGQTLLVRFRTADSQFDTATVDIYNDECSPLPNKSKSSGGRSQPDELRFTSPDDTQHYLSVMGHIPGSVYSICVP